MHSSFRDVSGSLSARSSSSFYLLAPPVPLRLFLSRSLPSDRFCRTPGLLLYTTRTNTAAVLTLALVRVPRLSLLYLHFSPRLQRGSDSCSFFGIHVLLSASSSFFLHYRIVARPFSGSDTNSRVSGPPCDAESP